MRYKHVLFDVDGTLYDTYFANMDALGELLKERYPERTFTKEQFDSIFGVPGRMGLAMLGIPKEDIPELYPLWLQGCIKRAASVKLFPGILALLQYLQRHEVQMAVVTSRVRHGGLAGTLGDCLPPDVRPYIKRAVCADDVAKPKPAPDSILHYMKLTGAKPEEILFVGDAETDLQCAQSAGVDFALALWGSPLRRHLNCQHYLRTPFDLINVQCAVPQKAQWFAWAREIQAIGQIGLNYCHDIYDEERFSRLREIASEMLQHCAGATPEEAAQSFLFDRGYITPKVDTRAAIFNDEGKILMVQEKSGLWNLPGGWCEENMSVVESAVKEVREEAGLACNVKRLVAVMDRNRHNVPPLPFGAVKFFFLCTAQPGAFVKNDETIACGWFAKDELPLDKLRVDTNTPEQIALCFAANQAESWEVVIE